MFTRTLRASTKMTRYLNQSEAITLDEELFNECHFGVEQLMELAGLSCATAIVEIYPESKNVLVVSGPGNNGGDGLVCARHLKVFGYNPIVYYPKLTMKTLYKNLILQCEFFKIPFLTSCPELDDLNSKYSLVVDAMFGFSFKPPVREEFKTIMYNMTQMSTPCCSIDIPSGWHVEKGPLDGESLQPEMLISLSAPKLCANYFKGKHHYLGGRFIPPDLMKKYHLEFQNYSSTQSHIKLSSEVNKCVD